MTHGLADDEWAFRVRPRPNELLSFAQNATALALGPGLGRDAGAHRVRRHDSITNIEKPMVVDADALFALAERSGSAWQRRRAARADAPPGRVRAAHRQACRKTSKRESRQLPNLAQRDA